MIHKGRFVGAGVDASGYCECPGTCLSPNQGWEAQPPFLAEIAKDRAVGAVPWLEGDRQLWHLQPRVTLMREHVKLACKQELAGVVAIHWRTEETRLNLDTFARFARDPNAKATVEDIRTQEPPADRRLRLGPVRHAEGGRRAELRAAPIRQLLEVYMSRVRSRGEQGVLSALNQKVWLQYREWMEFLEDHESSGVHRTP